MRPRGVMGNVVDCDSMICEFELQSRYYVPFRANTLGKDMKPFILSIFIFMEVPVV